MKIKLALVGIVTAAFLSGPVLATDAETDRQNFVNYFSKKFSDNSLQDFADGVYSIDKASRDSWEAIEDFPPYEPYIEEGEEMWDAAFKNGKGYGDCFPDGPGQRGKYPYWDQDKLTVMTLPVAVNDCRKANGEKPLKYYKGKIASLLAYMAYESRGQKTNVAAPSTPEAIEAYEAGRHFFYARRGQLNLACAHCHALYSGSNIRTDVLSPALGHSTGWPVYRSKWGNLGTFQRRFAGCNKQVRAKWFKAQGPEYRNLEYFLTYMSNGIEFNGPSSRK